MTKLERHVDASPAYDHREKRCGVHGVDLRFYVKGPKGIVQFLIYTNWYLPHVADSIENKPVRYRSPFRPFPADVGYHSYTPIHEGDTPITESCDYLEGKPCYYDGSGLMANEFFDVLVTEGLEAVWKKLEEMYHIWLEGEHVQ